MSHYAMMFRTEKAESQADVEEYNRAVNMLKAGIEMAMDGVEEDAKKKSVEGLEMAWEGMKKVCDLSKKMKEQYGERHNESYGGRYNFKEWSPEDDHMMERRMRDSMGRFK